LWVRHRREAAHGEYSRRIADLWRFGRALARPGPERFRANVTFRRSRFALERDLNDDDEDAAVSDGRASTAPARPEPEPERRLYADRADADIVEAIARGEARLALVSCVERHGASIGRLCMAMVGSQLDADDITQETLIAAHQGFREFRGEGSLRGWLFGIARNKCLQHLEKSRRRAGKHGALGGVDAEPGLEEMLGAKKRAAKARALLEHVRPSDRDALLLRFGADLSFREVATACGIDEATARKRVSRALLRLRSVLGRDHDGE
jgi:RNA polymerase sigma-70 factor, ECF subfamily